MEILLVIVIFLLMINLFSFAMKFDDEKELYYLKNLRFQSENPDVVIHEKDNQGDYFVSYRKNGIIYYHFFKSHHSRNSKYARLVVKDGVDKIDTGKRLSYRLENSDW